jgi:hypothetical protein
MTEKTSKLLLLGLAISTSLVLHGQDGVPGSPGCGAPKEKFDVSTAGSQTSDKAGADQALIYFIQNDSSFNTRPRPTTRVGLDGAWAGATAGDSYFVFPVSPGTHHLCASWQGSGPGRITASVLGAGSSLRSKEAAMSFTAQPGAVYYFVVENVYLHLEHGSDTLELKLDQVNNDQGQLLVNKRKLCTATKKN